MFDKKTVIEAAEVLGLPPKASRKQIQEIYRKLTMECHPDRKGDETHDMMAKITDAYSTVMKYCEQYEIPFTECDMPKNGKEWWIQHFGDNM